MGAPLTAPPGLGVLRPPPLPRRGPPRLRAGTGWCGERRGADESPGASQGGPAVPFPRGGERGRGAGGARLSRLSPPCMHVSLPSGPGGREREADGTWVLSGPLRSSLLTAVVSKGRPAGRGPLALRGEGAAGRPAGRALLGFVRMGL